MLRAGQRKVALRLPPDRDQAALRFQLGSLEALQSTAGRVVHFRQPRGQVGLPPVREKSPQTSGG